MNIKSMEECDFNYLRTIWKDFFMYNLLHKYMLIVCAEMLVRDVQINCPGWVWVIMEIDTQIAKKKGTQQIPVPANREEDVGYEEGYNGQLDGVSKAVMCCMLHGLKMISEFTY